MSMKHLRKLLLFAPVALAVACSSPTNPRYPQPDPTPPPRHEPPATGTMQPAPHDSLNAVIPGS